MGCGPFSTCRTNSSPRAVPPNPSPDRWEYIEHKQFAGGYVLKLRYLDCTNYEGVKVMVYRGSWTGRHFPAQAIDPHFARGAQSPIARFRPDAEGWRMACALAESL